MDLFFTLFLFLSILLNKILNADLSIPSYIYRILPYEYNTFLLASDSQNIINLSDGQKDSILSLSIINLETNVTSTPYTINIKSTFPSIALLENLVFVFDISNFNDTYSYSDNPYSQKATITIIEISKNSDESYSFRLKESFQYVFTIISNKNPISIVPFSTEEINIAYSHNDHSYLITHSYNKLVDSYINTESYLDIENGAKCILLSKLTNNILCSFCIKSKCFSNVYTQQMINLATTHSKTEIYSNNIKGDGITLKFIENDKILMCFTLTEEKEDENKIEKYLYCRIVTYKNDDKSIHEVQEKKIHQCSFENTNQYTQYTSLLFIKNELLMIGCLDQSKKKMRIKIYTLSFGEAGECELEDNNIINQNQVINYGLDNKYLFIYSDFTNNNVKAKFFFYYICKEKEFSKGKNEKDTFNLKDDIQNECSFKNDYTSKIIFTSLPTGLKLKYKLYGSFVDIEPNNEYEIDQDFQFIGKQSGEHIITYKVGKKDFILSDECQLKFKIRDCYPTCYNCTAQPFTEDNRQCITCVDGAYFVEGKLGYCTSVIEDGFFLNNYINEIQACYQNCKKCTSKKAGDIQNCKECIDDYYPIDGLTEKNCYSKDLNGYYLDQSINKLKKCYQSCETCSFGGDSSSHNCDTCQGLSRFKYFNNCYSTCPSGLVTDLSTSTCYQCPQYQEAKNIWCKNCKSYGEYFYIDSCVNKIPEGMYVKIQQYNVLDYCYSSCKSCSYKGNDNLHGCTECKDNYYTLSDVIGNCVSNCPSSYFKVPGQKVCHICFSYCLSCEVGGSNINHQCTVCKKGYTQDKINPTQCHRACQDKYWIVDNTNNYQCVDTCESTLTNTVLIQETNQCVKSCDDPLCFYCNGKTLYNDNNICVEQCPQNSIPDDNNVCIHFTNPTPGDEDGDDDNSGSTSIEIKLTLKRYLKTLQTFIESFKQNKEQTPNFYMKVIGTDFTSIIYDESEIDNHNEYYCTLNKEAIIYTDECQRTLNYNSDIFTIQITLERDDDISPQIEYALVNENGELIDLSLCQQTNVTVYSPIESIDAIPYYNDYLQYKNGQYHIDIYDAHDRFFNDLCYEYEKDITLKDRQTYIYKNVSLCEENCKFDSIDLQNKMIKCQCTPKPEVSDYIQNNMNHDSFENESNSLFDSRKCSKKVFDGGFIQAFTSNVGVSLTSISIVVYISYLIGLIFKGILTKFPLIATSAIVSPPQRISAVNLNVDMNTRKTNQQIEIEKFLSKRKKIVLNESILTQKQRASLNKNINDTNNQRPIEYRNNRNNFLEVGSSSRLSMKSIKEEEHDKETAYNNKNISYNKSINGNRISIYSKLSNLNNTDNGINEKIKEKEEEDDKSIKIYITEEERRIHFDLEAMLPLYQNKEITFCKLYFNYIKIHQSILYLIIYQSHIEPFSFRYLYFIFELVYIFAVNTLFFISPWYISSIYQNKKDNENDIDYLLKYDWIRILISLISCVIICKLLRYFVSPHRKMIESLENEKTIDILRNILKKIYFWYKLKILGLCLLITFIIFFFGYLTTILFNILTHSSNLYLYGCLLQIGILYLFPFIWGLSSIGIMILSFKFKNEFLFSISKP